MLDKASIFDPAFLESLAHLRVVARRVPAGGRFAEHRSEDLGGGVDFRDFRPYSPGDDFRSIDWNIYQRLGKVFLRLYEEQEDLPLYLLPDVSSSLFVEEPPRIIACLRVTLAMASIFLRHHDTVGVYPFSDDVSVLWPPQSGAGRLGAIADRLVTVEPGGSTNLAAALKRFSSYKLRRGVMTILSDFFDPNGLDVLEAALKRVRHRVVLVALVRKADRDPALRGELRLVDCESGFAEEVSVSEAVLHRYRQAYDAHQTHLAHLAKARGAGLIRVDVDEPLTAQLAALFESGVMTR